MKSHPRTTFEKVAEREKAGKPTTVADSYNLLEGAPLRRCDAGTKSLDPPRFFSSHTAEIVGL